MRHLLSLACLTVLVMTVVRGQSPNGTISGLVADSSGAVIVGADVLLENDATGVQYSGKTNGDGLYLLSNLPPGTYRLQVSKIGFKTIIKPEIILSVQAALAVNFTLPVGAASEIVTVTAEAPLLDTESAAVSTVVDRHFAENLPMNGRSFQTLIELTPGVVVVPSNLADSGQFAINGQRAVSNYWMVDGVSANIGVSATAPGNGTGGALGSFSILGGTNSLVSVDAMQEFRIQTSSYAPEFGRTPGGQISILTRSGSNQFHGTLFDYLRNDVLDANNWFNTAVQPALPKAEERQNDFGGTLGGPILKDKTFFFFSYEGLRLRLPQTALTTVPDAAAREDAASAMQPYLDAFPLPNGNQPDVAPGIAPFNASYSNAASLDAYSLRIDDRVRNTLSLFGRYSYSPSSVLERGAGGSALSNETPEVINIETATAGATWTLSPALSNDLRFDYSRAIGSSSSHLDDFGGAVSLTSLPLPAAFTSSNGAFFMDIFPLLNGLLQPGKGMQNVQRQINVVDTASLQKGSHALKFGIDFRRLSPTVSPAAYSQTVDFFDLPSAEQGNTGIGLISSHADLTLLLRNLSVFAQDTWRATPRLTVTYGLRWDVDFVPSSLNGPSIPAVTGYDLNDFSGLVVAPPGTQPFKTTFDNFAPRLGVAYELRHSRSGGTVLRGGWGVFYDLLSSETGRVVGSGYAPFGSQRLLFGPALGGTATFPYSSDEGAPPAIPSVATISQLYAVNPHLKQPYTLEWNVALEQSLGSEQTLTASYVGASGRRLLQTSDASSPPSNPAVNGFFVDNTGSSDYDALQVEFQRRLSLGLQVLASYAWSHSIDTGSAGSYTGSISNAAMPGNFNANRGSSSFDIRNAFSMGLTYDVPSLQRRALLRTILVNWSTNNFVIARSAPPVDIIDAAFYAQTLSGGGFVAAIRPDVVSGQPFYLYGNEYPGRKALNPAGFTNPPVDPQTGEAARQGDTPRNLLRGFGAAQWDFAIHRDFPIHDTLNLQFRAEMFNVLNHPNFGSPNNFFGIGKFGVSTQLLGQSLVGAGGAGSGALSSLYQLGGPRSIQFALKLKF